MDVLSHKNGNPRLTLTPLFDLPPTPENPRNSEGAFLPLESGALLFAYSRFFAGDADEAGADIFALRIEGDKPGEPYPIARAKDEGARNLMSVSLMRMENGDIGLFYLRREIGCVMRMVLRRSSDEGRTWSDPVYATPREGYFVINNDRAVRLSDGRIVLPAAEHCKQAMASGTHFDSRAEAVFFVSDDDGASWHELPPRCTLGSAPLCKSGLQEPGLIELYPGVLRAWARTDLGCQYTMLSVDGGQTFTPPEPWRFSSPLSPLSLKRLSSGALLVLYNPVPLYNGRSFRAGMSFTGGRTPLAAALSFDNGATYTDPIELETDPDSGYCYTAICEHGGAVYLGYCAGSMADLSCLKRLRVAKLTIET